jgi:membrane-associated phospholipid phosphatase
VSKNSHRKELPIVVGLSILALVISLFAHFESRFPGDLELTILFQSIHSRTVLTVMESISYATGEWRAAVLVIIGGIVVWRCLGRLEGSLIPLAGLITFINDALKMAINRPRPTPDLVTIYLPETGKSFPSGHAFFAILVLGMLAYLAITYLSKPGMRLLTLLVFLILIILVGASRIYLGAHWTSDIVGGYIVGGWFLVALIWLYQILKPRLVARNS